MFRFHTLFIAIVAIFLASSCKDNANYLSTVTGKAWEVGIVMDRVNWEGELGMAMRSVLNAEHPFLPQPEPLFTIFNISDRAFTSIFQHHRNLILIRISPEFSDSKMVIQQDLWARSQIVVTLSGPRADSVLIAFETQKEKLVSAIEQAERNRVIVNSKKYEDKSLRMLVNESFGGSPYFPAGYALRKQAKDFIWIGYETTYTTQGILIYSYPYIDATSFSKATMLKERNTVLQKEVPGQLANSYMTTHTGMGGEPALRWVHYDHKDFAELRGLWEVQNDFMGGPFISHSYLDTRSNRVLVLEAFVYSPSSEKRNYIRQTESILYSFAWLDSQEEK